MLTVATVLRSGGDYKPIHVSVLRDAVRRHLRVPHRFVCLTDMAVNCEMVPLRNNWPTWWAKIELFHADMPRPVFYMDLDTVVVREIDDIVLGHRFTVLENFWSKDRIGSGLMAWDADLSAIYRAFEQSPDKFVKEYRTLVKWGDQGFINSHTPIRPELWQRKHPGRVVSYKMHCRKGVVTVKDKAPGRAVVPNGASIVCYHGRPRPWETSLWKQQQQQAA